MNTAWMGGAMLALALANGGCAAIGASMRVTGRVGTPAAQAAVCEVGPGALPTAARWTPAQRQVLESTAHDGLVVVASDGCHVRVLDGCRAKGAYSYVAVPLKTDRRELSSGSGLGAGIAVLGSNLGGSTGGSSHYAIEVAITGTYRADRGGVRADELEGACAGATHVVSSYDAGAFVLTHSDGYHSGASTGSVAATGFSGYSGADETDVSQGGQIASCYAPRAGANPMPDCSAAVDVHLAEIAPVPPPAPPPPVPPTDLPPPPPAPPTVAVDVCSGVDSHACAMRCAAGEREACESLGRRCGTGDANACLAALANELRPVVPAGLISTR